LGFDVLGVDGNAGHRAHLHTLRLIKMAHALGAFGWVDFVNLFTQVNGLVRALGLAHITVDAFVGDHQCHLEGSAKGCIVVMAELSTTQISRKKHRAVHRTRSLPVKRPAHLACA
jgi:hypothetical protein